MTTKYFIAPNGRWSARDLVGDAAINGTVKTFVSNSDIPKPTYQDSSGTNPNTNPINLDSKGEANIYWADDAFYRIEVYDVNGQLIYSQNNYPYTDATGGGTVNNYENANLVRNPQFTWWTNSDSYPAITQSNDNNDYITDDWTFFRSNLNATIAIAQAIFTLGQSSVPASPVGYLNYECTDVGAGAETYKRFQQRYKSVQTLANIQIAVAFYAKSSTSSTITMSFLQNFGTGGSPSATVETIAITAALTTSWAQYQAIITLPTVAGKTLGSNLGDALILALNMPLNAIASVDICNVQLHTGSALPPFPYATIEAQLQRLVTRVTNSLAQTGDTKFTLRSTADPGWLLMNDSTIGNPASGAGHIGFNTKALFEYIWNGISNVLAPIYNSDGTSGARGVSAEADFNANKRLMLTRAVGRVFATAGQASLAQTFTGDPATSELTITDSGSFYTGTPLILTTTGTLPAPLATSTTYYVINIDATHIKLATSLANALAGTFITLTTTGTGTHTATINYLNHTAGQFIGEESHALIVNEMPAHNHPPSTGNFIIDIGGGGNIGVAAGANAQNQGLTGNTGGNQAHNNMQPTVFMNTMIKL